MTRGTFELICNRKGRPYLVVKRVKTNKGRIFQFTTISGKDVTEFMYKALKGEYGQRFPGGHVQSNPTLSGVNCYIDITVKGAGTATIESVSVM